MQKDSSVETSETRPGSRMSLKMNRKMNQGCA